MTVWRTVGGVDWLTPDPDPDEPPRTYAQLGLVLAHGYAHESPAELGIGSAAAAALQRVPARPVETPDHRVVEPSVRARVGLQETVVRVHGELVAVRAAAAALERLLTSAEEELRDADLPDARYLTWDGWGSELGAWFGVGPVSLAAERSEAWAGDRARLADFLRSLHPRAGRRVVAWTTAPELVGSVLGDPVPFPDRAPQPLRWRDPAPTRSAGSVRASHVNNLLTVRAPTGPLTDVALARLGRTVQRSLVVLGRQVAGLEVTWDSVGAEELYALRATPREGVTDWVAVRAALVEALDAADDAPDDLLAEELEQARAGASPTGLAARAVAALRTGDRAAGAPPVDELGGATVEDLRRALRHVRAGTLVSVPEGELPAPGRPWFTPPPPPPVARPTVTRRSRVPVWLRGIPDRQRVRADATTLEQTLTPRHRNRAPGALGEQTQVVDLTRLAARVDRGEEYSLLVDEDDRRLTLVWPAYRRPAALRALVDGATRPGTTLRHGADLMAVAQLRSDVRRHRVSTALVAVLLLLALVLVLWAPVTGTPEQADVVTTVAVGQEVTLGNGSTVLVTAPTWRSVDTSTFPVLVVDVRYCGGGPTVDDRTAEDARNYLSPDRFELTGIAPASRQTYVLAAAGLEETQLREGQCTRGALAFDIDDDRPAGIVVSYRNGSGDRVGWALG